MGTLLSNRPKKAFAYVAVSGSVCSTTVLARIAGEMDPVYSGMSALGRTTSQPRIFHAGYQRVVSISS